MKRRNASILSIALALCTLLCAASPALAQDELKNTDPLRYYVYVNVSDQVVTVYERDDTGEYTRIVRRMLCTTGIQPTQTPTGTYKIGGRERFGKFANFNNEYARYWTQVVRGIYFHSIMFGRRDSTTLKKTPYGTLGKRASHGCIRLYVEDAKWLYYNACPGTTVTIGGENRISAAEKKGVRSTLSFDEYKQFQINMYDLPETAARRAWITSDGAAMRTGNGSNDRYIARLKPGTPVEVLQAGDPWVKVLVDEREGYVKRIHVTYTQGVQEVYADGRATKSTTNIYAVPDIKAEVLCRMPRDTSLNVLEADEAHGWYKIQYWDVTGYIRIRNTRVDLSTYPYAPASADFFPPADMAADSDGTVRPAAMPDGVVPISDENVPGSDGLVPTSDGVMETEDVPAEELLDG